MQDTIKTIQGITPADNFLSYLYNDYFSSGVFWGTIIVLFVIFYFMRVLVWDNKNVKLNSKGWFYPLSLAGIMIFVVWLKNDAPFALTKKYLSDLITQTCGTAFLYMLFGHKLIEWLSSKTPFFKTEDKGVTP